MTTTTFSLREAHQHATKNLACTAVHTASSVIALQKQDIKAAIELIEKVRKSEVIDREYHLKPKTYAELNDNLANGYPLLGIKSPSGKLIAFCMISPTPDNDALMIKSVCSDPDCRGQGLGTALLAAATNWAATSDIPYLLAKVATDNPKSLHLFKNGGFSPSLSAKDAKQGYLYCYMMKHSPAPRRATTAALTQLTPD